jgi:hypothetical protein
VEVSASDAFSGAKWYGQGIFRSEDIKEGSFLRNSCGHTGRFQDTGDMDDGANDRVGQPIEDPSAVRQ